MRKDERGPWYLFTGLILGVSLGLLYAWVISPVQYVDTAPASLRQDFKEQYRALVAAAYLSSGNLDRAQARLALLGDADIARSLSIQAQQALAENHPESETRALGLLAAAMLQENQPTIPTQPSLTVPPPATITNTPTPLIGSAATEMPTSPPTKETSPTVNPPGVTETSRSTSTPNPTITPLPTRTPTSTPGLDFILATQELICEYGRTQPMILVDVRDASDNPVPGKEIMVTWENHEDHFFTGLKPELGLGYADFVMQPAMVYSLRLAEGGQTVSGLTPMECEAQNDSRFLGSWLLVFIQPGEP